MVIYIIKRLLLFLPVVAIVATCVFFMLRLVPGDPVDFILGENAPQTDRQALVAAQGFDLPVGEQYIKYLSGLAQGDLGKSYFSGEQVTSLIGDRYPLTLELAFRAIFWALLIAVPAGVWSALKKGSAVDQSLLVVSLLGISIPSFYLGPVLVLIFSLWLDWLPVSGQELPGSSILPSLVLGAALSGIVMRMTRSSLMDTLSLDYVRTATAKGLSRFHVVVGHALRTALIPVVAILGLQFGTLLAGAIVTEKIFSWPGLGSLMLESISRRDYAVVQGCVLIIALSYGLVNLLTDLVYAWLDPRVKLSEGD